MVGSRQTRLTVHLFLTRIFIGILISSTGALEVFSAESETNRRYYFDQFTTGEGLFRKNIDCIIQDEDGFIYTCTSSGLYIFNGNSFKVLNQDYNPKISNKTFSALSIGSGKIIIGTVDKGLYIYDKRLEKIYHPELVLNDRLLNPSIRFLFEDQQGVIWAGCTSGRVLIIDKQDLLTAGDKTVIYCKTINTGNSHAVNSICQWGNEIYIGTDGPTLYYIHADKSKQQAVRTKNLDQSCRQILSLHVNNNMLWIGSDNCLMLLKRPENNSEPVVFRRTLEGKIIKSIASQKAGTCWIGTRESGLFRVTISEDNISLRQFIYDPFIKKSINSNSIISLFIGAQGNLWIGTWFGGLNRTQLKRPAFQNIYNAENENEIQKNIVWSIEKSGTGKYWLGTHANGLNQLSPGENVFRTVLSNDEFHSVSSILELTEHRLLFVGTWGNGLKVLKPETLEAEGEFRKIFRDLDEDRIYDLKKDNYGNIWIATYYNGLFRYNVKTKSLVEIPLHAVSEMVDSKTDARCIFIDNDRIWVGSFHKGVFSIDMDHEGNVLNIKHLKPGSEEPDISRITSFIKTGDEIICTTEDGVFKVTDQHTLLRIFPEMKGKVCTHAQWDHAGNIWFTTYSGLYRYSFDEKKLIGFFPDLNFYRFLSDTDRREMIACSNNGLFSFHPDSVLHEVFIPEISFSGLKIFDHPVAPGEQIRGRTIIEKNLFYCDTLVLPHLCNVFSFDIQVLALSGNQEHKIVYQMEGVDPEWISRDGPEINVSYTNMPSGEYSFYMKSDYSDTSPGSEPRILKIIKLKPWWHTNWAYSGYILVILMVSFFFIRNIRNQVRIKNEFRIEKIRKEKDDELNSQKLAFFTNISHELRTPLTLILTPLEEVIQRSLENHSILPFLRTIRRNTQSLLRLINQILDFRKMEGSTLQMNLHRVNLTPFIAEIIEQYKEQANYKKIEVEFETGENDIWWIIDPFKFESILFNLISNSIKYTPEYGQMLVRLEKTGSMIILQFTDTGIGMSAEELPHIFDRFYRAPNPTGHQGTGIGLALVSMYVELHNGSIDVRSAKGEGTTFTITLNEIEGTDHRDLPVYEAEKTGTDLARQGGIDTITTKNQKKYRVLVVEDNLDMLNFLLNLFEPVYEVLATDNGAEGYELAKRKNPDIIISDVMMEGIDGFMLCDKLKANLSTSHIPVILLTAKKETEAKIQGIEMGADAYIEKPFNTRLLLTQINKLIEHREKLKARFTLINVKPEEIGPSSVDEEFLKEITRFIENHIQDTGLTVNTIAEKLKISHDKLYRKIKSLTAQSANQFIRMIRLKKAVTFIQQDRFNISEIGYMVGFNSPSYFTKCFRDEFGMSPSEYYDNIRRLEE